MARKEQRLDMEKKQPLTELTDRIENKNCVKDGALLLVVILTV